jgi:hypothetical protein
MLPYPAYTTKKNRIQIQNIYLSPFVTSVSQEMLKIAYVCVRLLKRKLGRLTLLEAITPVRTRNHAEFL